MRIDKLLAHTGFGTRKEVKQLLKKKVVQIDNQVITKGDTQVDPESEIVTVNQEELTYRKHLYLMLHKPAGVVSATFDHRDKTVIDLVPEAYAHFDLFPVGRLDKDTEGLLLLTNDGPLNHLLTSPRKEIIKTYYAKIAGYVTDKEVELFKGGLTLDDGYNAKPADLRILTSEDHSEVEVSITEGKFHQVKRMFEAVNMSVIYLKRISMGSLILDKQLQTGKLRLLNENELAYVHTLKKNKG